MRITALLENTAFAPEFEAEHGLSLYIETDSHRILFDMGQTDMFARNAERLHIDLSAIDIAILSHGHYDHSGGLARFLAVNRTAKVYANRSVFDPHYSSERYIGMDPSLSDSDRIIRTGDDTILEDGLSLHTCNARPRMYRSQDAGMFADVGGARIADDFRHEQYLLIEDRGRRIAVSGCSHKGICNIARWMRADVLIGGFHMKGLDPADPAIAQSARSIADLPTRYFTCHCTGTAQYEALKRLIGEKIDYLSCGRTIEV